MKRQNGKSVYIIAVLVAALAGMTLPGATVSAQVGLPGAAPDLTRLPLPDVERRVRDVEDDVRRTREEAAETVEESVESTVATALETVEVAGTAVTGLLRAFEPGVDTAGRAIEAQTLVVLVDAGSVASVFASGIEIIGRRELHALGKTMLTLRNVSGRPLAEALADFRSLNPQVAADYNHLYRWSSDATIDGAAVPAAARDDSPDESSLRIGLIDSDVMPSHSALQQLALVRRDFAVHEGERPQTHGTAVTSLIAQHSGIGAQVYSASVFFQSPGMAPGASAESLVAALDWLVSENVDVINMSLAGPGNVLLEAAVTGLTERGELLVAAVGNNGPRGEPQYPAAYDGVIGVTAVDRDHRIFRYANRGPHVDYAAIGVNVKIADSTTGGWRIESGTSMAAPRVAVIVAQTVRAGGVARDAVNSWLMAEAQDLGRRGHDPVFGHGLITRPPVVVSSHLGD